LNKKERVLAALRGEEVDRPPFSFWYHFGLQHMRGTAHAHAEVDFYKAYDLDFIKVMNDYPYPMPAAIQAVESEDNWKRLEPVGGDDDCWSEELTALSQINDTVGKEAMFIETIFSPWTTARRLAKSGFLKQSISSFPETVLKAMDAISTSLANYAKQAVARGASGIFLSLGAATDDVMPAEEYKTFCRPFDLKILNAVSDAPFNVVHIHGNRIHFDSVRDYPASAFNWSHYATAPSLKTGKELLKRTVMGGINEATASHVSAPEIAKQVKDTIEAVGTRGLIITPGCSVPTDTAVRNLKAVKESIGTA